MSEWITVKDRPPVAEVEVLLLCKANYGDKDEYTITTGIHEDGCVREEDSALFWHTFELEYDDETDLYIIPEGWYELIHYGDGDVCRNYIEDDVVAWARLPDLPKEV